MKIHPYQNPALSAKKRVKDLLGRMTLEEKAAQMMCVWQEKAQKLVDEQGNFDPAKARAAFKMGHGLGQVGRPSDAGSNPATPADGKTARGMAELTNAILLWPRLWDAFFDPVMGVLADRTNTRWGKFRPWILWTSLPWAVVMVLAYTVPDGGSHGALIAYAGITNTMLMTLYSMNNMPYSALGGVMTGDLDERAGLNSFRFIAVNIAQFVVGGFTLPLVAKFALGHDRAHGWHMTMMVWAGLCLSLFLITFATTRERIKPMTQARSSPRHDFVDLLRNSPWSVMFCMTLVHFAILSFRGGALYNYFHHYADKAAMFDFVGRLGLTAGANDPPASGLFETLGYMVHGDRGNPAASNVADVFNTIDKP